MIIDNIVSIEDYLKSIWLSFNGTTPPQIITLPENEVIYEINLNTRTINSPRFLSVEHDHVSETIYFTVDRMFGDIDLATTTCVIQYVNALGESRIYPVPFYDLTTFSGNNVEKRYVKAYVLYSNYKKGKYYILNNGQYILSEDAFDPKAQYYSYVDAPKILFPWVIGNEVTKASGLVSYSIRFYQIDYETEQIIYNLNTQPASSQILNGLDANNLREEQNGFSPTELEKIYDRINRIASEGGEIHWIDF